MVSQVYSQIWSVSKRNVKLLLEAVTYMATMETTTCLITIEIVMYTMHYR